MKIIDNKDTLLYNLPKIHSIQRYNDLCELTKCICIIYAFLLIFCYQVCDEKRFRSENAIKSEIAVMAPLISISFWFCS